MAIIAVIHLIALRAIMFGYETILRPRRSRDQPESARNQNAGRGPRLGRRRAGPAALCRDRHRHGRAVFSNRKSRPGQAGCSARASRMSQPLNAVLAARLRRKRPNSFARISPRATPAGNVLAFFHTGRELSMARVAAARGPLHDRAEWPGHLARGRLRQGPRGQRSVYGARTLLRGPACAAASYPIRGD